jgi:hypothetical protein
MQKALDVWARVNPQKICQHGFRSLAPLKTGKFRIGKGVEHGA